MRIDPDTYSAIFTTVSVVIAVFIAWGALWLFVRRRTHGQAGAPPPARLPPRQARPAPGASDGSASVGLFTSDGSIASGLDSTPATSSEAASESGASDAGGSGGGDFSSGGGESGGGGSSGGW